MPLKTEETFQIHAPADRVWAYLVDPRQVVACLPGAELTSVQDESTFLGKIKVKVGPVVASYSGKVVITERDDGARVVRMVGEGRESTGGGSAKVVITSTVGALLDGGTEVRVTADLDIVGKGSTIPQVAPAGATFAAPGGRQSQNLAIETVRPVRLVPLIGRALWDWFAGLVRRLVGRRPNVSR